MNECDYCSKSEKLKSMLREIVRMKSGTLYLHSDQTQPGRCILAVDRHVRKITELSKAEYLELMDDVYEAVSALTSLFKPDKINMLILGDTAKHMHLHLVPKYAGRKDWGRVFTVDEPNPVILSEQEYEASIVDIRKALRKG